MKCICRQNCQVHVGKRIVHFEVDQVQDFPECPSCFDPLEGTGAKAVDFDTAGKEELMEATFELDDLKEYIFKNYDVNPGNRGLEKTVDMLIDRRFRALDVPGLGAVT